MLTSVGSLLVAALSLAPWQLRCLERYYAGKAKEGPTGWVFELTDGRVLPFDDGTKKTAAHRLEHPDLEDLFVQPYRRGPALAVRDPNEDPGRARVAELFDATYGDRQGALPLREVRLGRGSVRVHERIAPALSRVAAHLAGRAKSDPAIARALEHPAGGYAARVIAGTARPSAHSWGIAVDIDLRVSDYWRWQKGEPRWQNRVPQEIIDAFESEGFIWGGRWYHFDTMHFEYRPELLDASCRSPSP